MNVVSVSLLTHALLNDVDGDPAALPHCSNMMSDELRRFARDPGRRLPEANWETELISSAVVRAGLAPLGALDVPFPDFETS